MEICILTYGRSGRQITWNNLPPSIQAKTYLVVQYRERHLYEGYPVHVLPSEITTADKTRQYMMTFPVEKICMLDDDLDFAVRREDEPKKFRAATPLDIESLFRQLEFYCGLPGGYALVGVAAREGGNFDTNQCKHSTRQMRVHAIDVKLYRELGIRFDRVPVMEDFDVILQFLEAGYENLVLNYWVTNQHGSNTDGGCSHYRTAEVQSLAAHTLAELHPGIVQVVKKQTKTAWGGGTRDDVRVYWKRAIEKGRAVRLLGERKRGNTAEEGEGFIKAMD